jgi:DNA-binding HxlR family transcriptional regulator
VRGYGQYCPIARGAEIFAERWTPIIVRNLLLGCETFTEIARGAPGIPRSLLAQRLDVLARHGIVERLPAEHGSGYRYVPTDAGRGLWEVCVSLGEWGARWLEVAPEHLDPYVALWSMCHSLAADRLPDRRVVVRFEFTGQAKKHSRFWLLLEHGHGEVCVTCPGEEDLIVTADPARFVRWHMGQLSWAEATADDAIRIEGLPRLARAFPRWNRRSRFARIQPVTAGRTNR